MSAQPTPENSRPDASQHEELTPPVDPWSSGDPLTAPDPLFAAPVSQTSDPLAPITPPPVTPSAPLTSAAPPSATPLPSAYTPPFGQSSPYGSVPPGAQLSSAAPLPSAYTPPPGQPSPYGATPPGSQPTHLSQAYPAPDRPAPDRPAYPAQGYPAGAPGYPSGVPGYPGAAPGYPAYPAQGHPGAVPSYNGTLAPYAQAPYSYPQAYSTEPVKSLRVPAGLAVAGLVLTLVFGLALEIIGSPLVGEPVTAAAKGVALAALVGYAVAFIYTIVTFMVWLHRASANLWKTGHGMKWRPSWTIGGWFIPIVNLVIPLMVIREVDRETRDHGPALFATWAVAWTLSAFLGRTTEATSTSLSALAGIALLASGISAALLIRRVTADQEQQFIQARPY